MKTFITFIVQISFCSVLLSQITELNIDPKNGCNYAGDATQTGLVYGFASSQEARSEVNRIIAQLGLPQNFQVKRANIPNAQAQVIDGTRYILYSQQFMETLRSRSGSEEYWIKVAILAHEIGHHLSGHIWKGTGSRPMLELEADQFSGFVLYKLGATLQEAQAAVRSLANNFDTPSHPAKSARLEAVAVGYSNAREVSGGRQPNRDVSNAPPRNIVQEDERNSTLTKRSGTVRDTDGNTYTFATMKDGRRWMTENLNVNVSGSYCYYDKSSNCTKYGRLYTWEAAKVACTKLGKGWRLPTDTEWREMAKQYGGADDDASDGGKAAYQSLIKGGASDFAALLGGLRYSNGSYSHEGVYGNYWSSTENDASSAWYYDFDSSSGKLYRYYYNKTIARSCVVSRISERFRRTRCDSALSGGTAKAGGEA